jgi:hypothetical protein
LCVPTVSCRPPPPGLSPISVSSSEAAASGSAQATITWSMPESIRRL